ncbi:MAG: ChaB family protein [Pseudomonadota bacterium]|nr:ChaB family protein [Chloroflexota bacterium]MDP9413914.1 ChaB family protein [Pseudomonadota bacterium]
MPTKQQRTGNSGTSDMPQTILRSDEHAQAIWKKTHDSAVETYGEGGRAHRVAFAALKHQYEKKGNRWVKKAEKGPSDPQAARGPTTEHTSTEEPPAPTAGGKVATTEQDARDKAKDARREYDQARR